MTRSIKASNTATVDEVAKALGIKADFVTAAEMTPIERGKAVADFNRKRGNFWITAVTLGAGIAISGLGLILSQTQHPPRFANVVMIAVGEGLAIAASFIAASGDDIPCPRADITTRAQANAMKAYNAMNAAAPKASP